MQPENLLPLLQQCTACPYPEPVYPSTRVPSYTLKLSFNIIFSFTTGSSKWPLSFRFPYQNPVYVSVLSRMFHTLHQFYETSSDYFSYTW